MISHFEASLSQLSVHKVGSQPAGDPLVLSEHPLELKDAVLDQLLLQYFIGSFEKVVEIYRLSHPSDDLELNEVFHFCSGIFQKPASFHKLSRQIAKHLYDVAQHPNIKGGELCVAFFKNVQLEGELHDAIGIFKSEGKESYLKVIQDGLDFNIAYEQSAIPVKKLDKGCLIFNSERDQGYKVAVVDSTNRTEAFYWVDQFLKLLPRSDGYSKTNEVLSIYKKFVTEKLDEQYSLDKSEKIDMLNRSLKYFKGRDQFDAVEFAEEVIGEPNAMKLFDSYRANYEKSAKVEIGDSFDISPAAVKKQSRNFKSVLKLDKNFHIYIHGNKELIEKGFDEEKNMNYYKVYFREEV